MYCDVPLSNVQKKPIMANVNRDVPSIRSLTLCLVFDWYVAGACLFYYVAPSLQAIGSETPLSDIGLQAKAIEVYRKMCDIAVTESALSVHKDLETETWGA